RLQVFLQGVQVSRGPVDAHLLVLSPETNPCKRRRVDRHQKCSCQIGCKTGISELEAANSVPSPGPTGVGRRPKNFFAILDQKVHIPTITVESRAGAQGTKVGTWPSVALARRNP